MEISAAIPESESDRLEAALALRDLDEQQRFARLEHDLRSALSIIVGFASILKEQAEKNTSLQPALVLKSANAILQAATKTLLVVDAASTRACPGQPEETATVETKL